MRLFVGPDNNLPFSTRPNDLPDSSRYGHPQAQFALQVELNWNQACWSDAQTTGLQSPESFPGLIRTAQTGDLMLTWNDSPYDPKFDHYGILRHGR